MAAVVVKHASTITQKLAVANVFEALSDREKAYAHFMATVAWTGARVVLRQVSEEAEAIFDLILQLHKSCDGEWELLVQRCGISNAELQDLLEYSALFLGNLGNYFGEGGQKFVPNLSEEAVLKLGKASKETALLIEKVATQLTSPRPAELGLPGPNSQSAYYLGSVPLRREEINDITKALEQRSIESENTRIRVLQGKTLVYEALQASVETGSISFKHNVNGVEAEIRVTKGDHSDILSKVNESLAVALEHAPSEVHKEILRNYIDHFRTGDLRTYRESQKKWVANQEPKIEDVFGFVESYHDPLGVRAEWQGLVAVSNEDETAVFKRFVTKASTFIRLLPWAKGTTVNDGKGPFEKHTFEAPDFTSVHALAYCSTIIFEGINLPNYNDIRETCGFKNIIIANRMEANVAGMSAGSFIDPSDEGSLNRLQTQTVHELPGHGSGKLLSEDTEGNCNFDRDIPPTNPITGQPVDSWYGPGQIWTSVFGDLATSVEECRASLVAAYLMDNPELAGMFGYSDESEITHQELLYNTYLLLGIEGVEALRDYSTWGQAHSRGHFGTLKQLLRHSQGCVRVDFDPNEQRIVVKVDKSKILPHAKEALGEMLLRLHVYRCTAGAEACRAYYEDLTAVEPEHEQWRSAVLARAGPRRKFVQANTFLEGGKVVLKEYDATNEGIIQSWAERDV